MDAKFEHSIEAYKSIGLNSTHIGSLGVRDDFFVKLLSARFVSKLDCWVYNIRTREGNLGVFYSSDGPTEFLLRENECAVVTMTPKRHDVNNWHGCNETTFGRPKIVENVGAST